MNAMYFGLLRHALTMAGGVLVSSGAIDQDGMEAAVGGAMTLIGVGWSVYEKRAR